MYIRYFWLRNHQIYGAKACIHFSHRLVSTFHKGLYPFFTKACIHFSQRLVSFFYKGLHPLITRACIHISQRLVSISYKGFSQRLVSAFLGTPSLCLLQTTSHPVALLCVLKVLTLSFKCFLRFTCSSKEEAQLRVRRTPKLRARRSC